MLAEPSPQPCPPPPAAAVAPVTLSSPHAARPCPSAPAWPPLSQSFLHVPAFGEQTPPSTLPPPPPGAPTTSSAFLSNSRAFEALPLGHPAPHSLLLGPLLGPWGWAPGLWPPSRRPIRTPASQCVSGDPGPTSTWDLPAHDPQQPLLSSIHLPPRGCLGRTHSQAPSGQSGDSSWTSCPSWVRATGGCGPSALASRLRRGGVFFGPESARAPIPQPLPRCRLPRWPLVSSVLNSGPVLPPATCHLDDPQGTRRLCPPPTIPVRRCLKSLQLLPSCPWSGPALCALNTASATSPTWWTIVPKQRLSGTPPPLGTRNGPE